MMINYLEDNFDFYKTNLIFGLIEEILITVK